MKKTAQKIKWKRLLFIFTIAAVFSFAFYLLPSIYDKINLYEINRQIETRLGNLTKSRVMISKMRADFSSGIKLRGENTILWNAEKGVLIKAGEIVIGIRILDLTAGKFEAESITVKNAAARFDIVKSGEEKIAKRFDLKDALEKNKVRRIEVLSSKATVCVGAEESAPQNCFIGRIESASIAPSQKDVKASMKGTVETPWYTAPLSLDGSAEITPSGQVFIVDADVHALLPPLKAKGDRKNLPETDNPVSITAKGRFRNGEINADLSLGSLGVMATYKGRGLILDDLSLLATLKATKEKIELVGGELHFGGENERTNAIVSGNVYLPEKRDQAPKRRFFKKIELDADFDTESVGAILGNNIFPKRKRWSASGAVSGRTSARITDDLFSYGDFDVTARNLRISVPGRYQGRHPRISAAGRYSWRRNRLDIRAGRITAGASRMKFSGSARFRRSRLVSAQATADAPFVRYADVKPLLPFNRMKEGGKRFFGSELISADLKNAKARVDWNESFRGNKRFLDEGLFVDAEVASAKMDFGDAPVKVRSGKISYYRGNISFFDVDGAIGDMDVKNLRLDIESLSQTPTLVIYAKDPFLAESLIKFLSARDFNIADSFENIIASGWVDPDVVIEIPLRKGEKRAIHGRAELKGFTFAVAGATPLMENMAGHVEFDGLPAKINDLTFAIGKMTYKASVSVADFQTPEFDIEAQTPDLQLDKFFSSTPPKKTVPGKNETKHADENTAASKLKIRMALTASKGKFKTLKFTNLKSKMIITSEKVTFDTLKMEFAGGKFHTEFPARVIYDGLDIKCRFGAKNMDPYEFMQIFGVKQEVIKGNMSLVGIIETTGISYDEAIKNLDGKISFGISNGMIEDSNIFFSAFNQINFDFSQWKARRLGYRQINGDIKIRKGVLTSDNMTASGIFMSFVAAGEIDVPREKLEMDIGLVLFGSIEDAFSKIPLVGNMLRSHSGKSYFAYYFRVKGSFSDYKVVQLGQEGVKEQINRLISQITGGLQ